MMLHRISTASCSGLFLLLTACSDGGGGSAAGGTGQGSMVIEITDAPIDPKQIAVAILEVDRVTAHREADGESGFVTIFDGSPVEVNLTTLRNGLTLALQEAPLEEGAYSQIRLRVTDAFLELRNGNQYSTRDGTIRLTSQDTSGYKIFLDPPVEIHEGVQTRVLVDFHLPKTFSPVPANDLENARFFHLHPNVRAAVLQETGELRGVVTTTDDQGDTVPAAGAAVYVLDPGATDPDLAVASTMTDEDGSAAILGLPAGTYDVLAVLGDESARAEGLVVTRGGVTSFEIHIE